METLNMYILSFLKYHKCLAMVTSFLLQFLVIYLKVKPSLMFVPSPIYPFSCCESLELCYFVNIFIRKNEMQ